MEDEVATFVALTGSSTEDAVTFLEMSGGDAELAANLYWDTRAAPTNRTPEQSLSYDPFQDEVRAPMESRVETVSDYEF